MSYTIIRLTTTKKFYLFIFSSGILRLYHFPKASFIQENSTILAESLCMDEIKSKNVYIFYPIIPPDCFYTVFLLTYFTDKESKSTNFITEAKEISTEK